MPLTEDTPGGSTGTSSSFAWVCIGLGLALSIILGLLSEGGYHDDALTHYLYARWAWNDPVYLVDEWGRPGHTCLLFPLAWLGWATCRVAGALLSAASAWMAWDVARRLGLRRSAWVPLLCFVQPLFLLASYTTLTETAAAFYLTLAIWCLMRDRPAASAAVLSLCFVTRYESLVFVPLWILAIRRCGGRWFSYPILLWAPVAHNLVGALLLQRWPVEFIAAAGHPTYYGAGTPLTMAVKSMAASGPPVAVLAIVGLTLRWPRRCGWLLPTVYAAYLLTHSLIFALGTYSSGGYPRFLVTTAPVGAVCAAAALGALNDTALRQQRRALAGLAVVAMVLAVGLELEVSVVDEAWLFLIEQVRPAVWLVAVFVLALVGLRLLRPSRWPGALLAGAAVVTAALPLAYLVRPHPIAEDARAMRSAAQWLETSPYAAAPVIATNTWASHFLDRGHNVVPPESPNILDGAEPGTIFIWDANHAVHPRYGLTPDSMTRRPHWHLLWQSQQHIGDQPAGRIYIRQ